MIRINLIAAAKSKGKRKFSLPKITTAGPSPLFVALGLVVACGGGLYLYYRYLESTHVKLQQQISDANRQIAAMTKVKQAYLERQKDYDTVKRRFDVIDQLRNSQTQTSPVPLLDHISQTVDQTEGVWLLNMRDDGASVYLDGISVGPNQLANLMTNLRQSGFFKNVELKDAAQEDKQTIQTFSFTLVCDKADKAKA
jgi:type IV pilus assembly protein PilN